MIGTNMIIDWISFQIRTSLILLSFLHTNYLFGETEAGWDNLLHWFYYHSYTQTTTAIACQLVSKWTSFVYTTTAYININWRDKKPGHIWQSKRRRKQNKHKAFHSHSNSTSMIGTNMIIDWISFQIRTSKQRSVLLAAGTARLHWKI